MKTSREWETLDGSAKVPTDKDGWPTADARVVAFDMRPTMAWAPPMDDPEGYQIDVSGTYHLSFKGKADVTPSGESEGVRVQNLKHDPKTDLSAGQVVVDKGKALVVLHFRDTKGGVKNVRLLRPGYAPTTKEIFHRPFLNALKPFGTLRFMDWLSSNSTNPFYGDAKNTTEWADRHVPADANQLTLGRKNGVAWEYVVALCKQTGKTPWINLPVAASDDYVRRVALMFRDGLGKDRPVYVEYNNEVWNWGFLQATYNRMAAEAEVKAGNSPLNNDGEANWDVWRRRRFAKRTVEIGRIFADVYGKGTLNKTVRPVMAWWVVAPDQFEDMLAWVAKTYGPPKDHLYAIAGAPYFNAHDASKTATVDEIIAAMRKSSDTSVPMRKGVIAVARKYGLHPFCYEGGPDTGGGDPTNVANRIRAHRDPRMGDLVTHDLRDNWFALGGDLFMYFTLTSAASRYGYWGLTDDVTRLDTPKWKAVEGLLKK
ncbi:MAG: hypothetical protein ACO1SV_00225 [Fimbriimonas sp.]